MGIPERIFFVAVLDGSFLEIDQVQEVAVVHPEFGIAVDHEFLLLELDDGDGLVQFGDQGQLRFGEGFVFVLPRAEKRTGVVGVGFHREGGQRQEVDAVAVFQGGKVRIAETHAQDIGHAGTAARSRTHPDDVVVAPLDIVVVIVAQGLHDQVCARAAVVDVADDVERVDDQPVDDIADGGDEVVRPAGGDDRVDDRHHVAALVLIVLDPFVKEFFDNIGILFREGLADLRTGIFRRADGHYLDDAHQHDAVPFLHLGAGPERGADCPDLVFRIIDKGAELPDLGFGERGAEDHLDFLADDAGAVAKHVLEGFVFTVQVADEMFRSLREVQDRFQVDDFRTGGLLRRETLGQQAQIFKVSLHGW